MNEDRDRGYDGHSPLTTDPQFRLVSRPKGHQRPTRDPEAPARVVLYTRASTDEQENSHAAQTTAVEEYATFRHLPIVARFSDSASGGTAFADREGGRQALAMLDSGQADILVCAKLDRLSRNLHDLTGTLAHAEVHRWSVVLLDVQVDTATLCGRLMVGLLGAVAEFERGRIGERTSAGMRAATAAHRGGRPATMPAEVRARIVAEYSSGKGFQAIADGLNADKIKTAQGGKVWRRSTVQYAVRHP